MSGKLIEILAADRAALDRVIVVLRRIVECVRKSDRKIVADPGARHGHVTLFRLRKNADFENLTAVSSALGAPLLLKIGQGGPIRVCMFRERDSPAVRRERAACPPASRDARVISAMRGGKRI